MDFIELAKKRYSVRSYSEKKVEQEKLNQILQAAHVAPTAANLQPIHLIAVQREEEERAKAQFEKRFFPEPKLLQTYLGKQRAWELYVTVGEEINDNEYRPKTTIELRWNDIYNCYLYTGQSWNPFPTDIYDGYTKENRPDGARIVLNNGRGSIHWSAEFKEWVKD